MLTEYVTRLAMSPQAYPLPGHGVEDMLRLSKRFVEIATLQLSITSRMQM